jgi:hypothetical protein
MYSNFQVPISHASLRRFQIELILQTQYKVTSYWSEKPQLLKSGMGLDPDAFLWTLFYFAAYTKFWSH